MSEINAEEKKNQENPQAEAQKAAENTNVETPEKETEEPEVEVKEKKMSRSERKKAEKDAKLVEELQKKVETLEAEKVELAAKLEKEKNDYLRLSADVDNIRKKFAEDRLDLIKTAGADLIKGMLPVLDDCEQAMKMLESSSDEAAKEGTALIYNKLLAYLKTKGLEQIEAIGKPFDTDEHEALTQLPAPSEDMKGKVIDVYQQGYRLGGKIIRFAKVIVGA